MANGRQSGLSSTWTDIQSKVRYRLIVLTSLPIILTLVSLVFVTIYWNVSYTGKQLFMKVKADLSVANNTLDDVKLNQQKLLEHIRSSYDFQRYFTKLDQGDRTQNNAIAALLSQQKRNLNLDFVRLIRVSEAAADPNLRSMLIGGSLSMPISSLMVLNRSELLRVDARLAEKAQIPIIATDKASEPEQSIETRGLVSRTLLPIADSTGEVRWLLDGGILFNRNNHIVDQIRDLVYDADTLPKNSIGAVTIFLDNVRISTNVPLNFNLGANQDRGRALGSLVSDEVRQQVLEKGLIWVNRAFVFNDWFISAYSPITDIRGNRIGMIYTGFSERPFVLDYLYNIIELGTILLIVMLISGYLVYRAAASLLDPIERIHHVVKAVQQGHNIRIGELGLTQQNELVSLARQFDAMLDQLQQRNLQIQQAAEQLEMKVAERTESLQERTAELQRNVQLLNDTRAQLVTNEKLTALGELTAGIAHEINNPSAVILGNMELIKLELGDNVESVEEEINTVIEQVNRISAIIRNLLQYSRPGEFNAPLELAPVNPLLEQTIILARHSIQSKQLVINSELNATHSIQMNPSQLQQVLINLVINAAHASSEQGHIWIRSKDWRDAKGELGVQIEVEDSGKGMSDDLMRRIFDPFFTTRPEGTGLGLSLSYGLVGRIGGNIQVESSLGKGSKFTVSLYCSAKDSEVAHPYDGLQIKRPLSAKS
ncbi:sensor histidine kinase [Paraferrimonas haliotis]|uniref:histidine kinase n=1 Tax=Paraferrimonas haliotis TaxID=2013866 RepID=A0AA37TJ88_9GAMM|nr:HAMP domain-containing sensor histidine kinase [Paraferrimonas haliotis]GLS82154.1 two-component sensor histidine kinase [Paraferrimonas haliotis]